MTVQTTMRNDRRSFEVYENGRLVAMFASRRSAEKFASGQPITKWSSHEEDLVAQAKAVAAWLAIQVRPMVDAVQTVAQESELEDAEGRTSYKEQIGYSRGLSF